MTRKPAGRSGLPVSAAAVSLPSTAVLASRICEEHAAAAAAAKSAVQHAIAAGVLLQQAKAQLRHGEWLPWLRDHCTGISERTAQFYTWLAAHREEIALLASDDIELTLRNVRKLLAGRRNDAARALPAQSSAFTPLISDRSPPAESGENGNNVPDARVVEFQPPVGSTRVTATRRDAFSIGALPHEDQEDIKRGQAELEARGKMTGSMHSFSGQIIEADAKLADDTPVDDDPEPPEQEACQRLIEMFIEKMSEAGEAAAYQRLSLADIAHCARAFRSPRRWKEMCAAAAETIDDQEDA